MISCNPYGSSWVG